MNKEPKRMAGLVKINTNLLIILESEEVIALPAREHTRVKVGDLILLQHDPEHRCGCGNHWRLIAE